MTVAAAAEDEAAVADLRHSISSSSMYSSPLPSHFLTFFPLLLGLLPPYSSEELSVSGFRCEQSVCDCNFACLKNNASGKKGAKVKPEKIGIFLRDRKYVTVLKTLRPGKCLVFSQTARRLNPFNYPKMTESLSPWATSERNYQAASHAAACYMRDAPIRPSAYATIRYGGSSKRACNNEDKLLINCTCRARCAQ
jgi:hypothetical protein